MATYKCGYCGEIGHSSTPPRTPCLPNRHSHAWRPMSESRIIIWKCRKCGMTTEDDQTPMVYEGGECSGWSGGSKNHTWDRAR